MDTATSTDTDVTKQNLPAVTQEHVQPTLHEVRTEHITREIHTHDVYHRVLPIIETETLPTKHYVYASDGKTLVEIPESQVPDHLLRSASNRERESGIGHYGAPGQRQREFSNPNPPHSQQNAMYRETGADPPFSSPAHHDPDSDPKYGCSSVKSNRFESETRTRNIMEPILGSREDVIKIREEFPLVENQIGRHPSAAESYSSASDSQPAPAGAGVSESSGYDYRDEEDVKVDEFFAMREGVDIDGQKRRESLLNESDSRGSARPGSNDPALSPKTLRRKPVPADGPAERDSFEETTAAMRQLTMRQEKAADVDRTRGA